jgi:dsRNA-specific ribonuclease
MNVPPTSPVETLIQYTFKDQGLLEEALRHSSFVNEITESGLRDNERLEFLGEGDLSRMRANLVNEQQLAGLARCLNLGAAIKLGKGEAQSGGREKNSILAGALEALLAAVYVDGGFGVAFEVIQRIFLPLVQQLEGANGHADFKSQLQELVQAHPGMMPSYAVTREEGPDHDKTFWVQLSVMNIETLGMGKSKKSAEQDAARQALALIKG